eukprot:m.54800 g.54800  ORF g.54800 m.54800 type:complete len:417 (+) comp10951_c0_seq3:180-1430(+)
MASKQRHASSFLKFRTENLLNSDCQYIVHQTNCTSTRNPKGLAKSLFEKFPHANTYNTSIVRTPGTISIHGTPSRDQPRAVINLYGQRSPGKPNSTESKADRETFFKAGLEAAAKISGLKNIAFPYLIGCGLAGGDWQAYLAMLEQFAKDVHPAEVYIYRLKDEPKPAENRLSGTKYKPMATTKAKLLVLLDMNGTLLSREKKVVPGREPDFRHKGTKYYLRPGAKHLVQQLVALPAIRVAFNTSMTGGNAKPAIVAIAGQSWHQKVALYDREYQKHDSTGEKKWDTIRDLDAIWKAEASNGQQFDRSNTVMVDDTFRKMREHADNVLIVPTYSPNDDFEDDVVPNVLTQATNYLLELVRSLVSGAKEVTVPEYIRQKPFCGKFPTSVSKPETAKDVTEALKSIIPGFQQLKVDDK